MRHINYTIFEVKGQIPPHVMKYLKRELGDKFQVLEDEEYIDIRETEFYKEMSASMIPGDSIRVYRENAGLSQAEFGKKLGEILEAKSGKLSKQYISDLEHGRREISKGMAKKLSALFKVPVSRFL